MKLNLLATVARCHTEKCCPTVYADPNGNFVVIGKKADTATRNATASRTAGDEDVVTLPREVILALIANNPDLVAEARDGFGEGIGVGEGVRAAATA